MPRQADTDDRGTNRRETTSRRTDDRRSAGQATMADVNHTNPKTGETFGDSQVFERGKIAVVDGGEAESPTDGDADDDNKAEPMRDVDRDGEPMRDVDHTPRKGAPDANEAYDRGVERVEVDETEESEHVPTDDTEPDVEADV